MCSHQEDGFYESARHLNSLVSVDEDLSKVCKRWESCVKFVEARPPQIQDRKLAGNAAIWDIHEIQKKKKHNKNKPALGSSCASKNSVCKSKCCVSAVAENSQICMYIVQCTFSHGWVQSIFDVTAMFLATLVALHLTPVSD